ncbi:hypothetical protein Q3H58_004053 [Pseudomonas psychrotolerans]|nr:hypothetical protein [Pseudomonas psychrotolerans]
MAARILSNGPDTHDRQARGHPPDLHATDGADSLTRGARACGMLSGQNGWHPERTSLTVGARCFCQVSARHVRVTHSARGAATQPVQPSPATDRHRRRHRHRSVHGLGQDHRPGRALDPAGLPDHRQRAVLRHARPGRAAAVESGIQVLHRFLQRPARALGRFLLRLDLLVLLDRHRHRRCHRHRRLCPVLAAGPGALDTGAALRAAPAGAQPGDGTPVR